MGVGVGVGTAGAILDVLGDKDAGAGTDGTEQEEHPGQSGQRGQAGQMGGTTSVFKIYKSSSPGGIILLGTPLGK